jgi:hypothetical protein
VSVVYLQVVLDVFTFALFKISINLFLLSVTLSLCDCLQLTTKKIDCSYFTDYFVILLNEVLFLWKTSANIGSKSLECCLVVLESVDYILYQAKWRHIPENNLYRHHHESFSLRNVRLIDTDFIL